MKNKIAFLILHYITIDDTKKCVESIEKIMGNTNYEYEIVIVDNHSSNGTVEVLKEEFYQKKNIHIIINEKNLGFANGNNVGFRYAKEKLKCNYIVMLNNDTYILQKEFADIIIKQYEKINYAVMGPKIILKDGSINPIRNKLPTISQVRKSIIINILLYVLAFINCNKLYNKILKRNTRLHKEKISNMTCIQENVILHGCCIIFSPTYIKKFDGLDERTFLYCEEELLFIRIKNNKMISLYNPNLQIYHMEDGATNAITVTSRNKKIFKHKNSIKSKIILYKELKQYYKNGDNNSVK